jgi:hypothetical protein
VQAVQFVLERTLATSNYFTLMASRGDFSILRVLVFCVKLDAYLSSRHQSATHMNYLFSDLLYRDISAR